MYLHEVSVQIHMCSGCTWISEGNFPFYARSIIPQWVLRIKLRLLGLCSKSLYLLSCPSSRHPTLMFSQFGSLVTGSTSLTQAAHFFSHSPFTSSYAWAWALCFCHDLHTMHWNIYWALNFMFSCNTFDLLWKTFLDHLLFFQILVNKTKGQSFSGSFFNMKKKTIKIKYKFYIYDFQNYIKCAF